jgi:ribosomal-protein-serine acetyltransferase
MPPTPCWSALPSWSSAGGGEASPAIAPKPKCALAVGEASRLRLLDEGDAPELHALIEANREQLARWLPWAAAQELEDTRAFIARTRQQVAANDGFQAAIVCDGRLAGMVGYVSVDWSDRSTRIGYWLGGEFQGKGTMTDAVRVLTEHALVEWDLNRVEIRAATENRRSRAIPERLGFREEGILRQAERVGAHRFDLVVYTMLAADSRG